MDKKSAVLAIGILGDLYPDAKCGLDFGSVYELAVATMLSAQCTDKRVNITTKELFSQAKTPGEMLRLGESRLKEIIRPCGLSNSKAKNIIAMSSLVLQRHEGKVPDTFSELTALPGIGPKTANVILSNAFGQDAIAVDTHVQRVSNRLGLSNSPTPEGTEKRLNEIIPKSKWSISHHLLIAHGRNVCTARNPKCGECGLNSICEAAD
ncbi:MAG: endonuclease III [Eubacteriaceae bacterium]|nr:endonuclease III [Eubacteriaceae bacterium]